MASVVDICNIALAHIGAESLVTSIDPPDGSAEAGYCATFYPIARRAALEANNWSFARTRVQLAEVTNPSETWLYAYAVPAGCIKPRRVIPLSTTQTSELYDWNASDGVLDESGSSNFEVEGDIILTNEPEAWLIYTIDVTNTSKFSPMFTTALGMLLAGYLAGPIIKGREAINIGTSWTQAGQNALSRAATADANAGAERADFTPQGIRARG